MTLSQLEILVELAREKSFSRVGEKLGITQPAVSIAIKKLEDEFNVALISRDRKEFELTEIGLNILNYSDQIVKQVRNIRRKLLTFHEGSKCKIIIGAVWSINNRVLPRIINSFKREFPEIDISIFEGTDQEIEGWLAQGTIDIGISGWANRDFIQEKLFEDSFLVVVSKKHPLSGKKIIDLEDVAHFPIVSSKVGCEPILKAIAKHHNIKLNIKFEAKEALTILSMVKEDLGISIFPELAVPEGFSGIVCIGLNTPVKRSIFISHRLNEKSVGIALFMNHIRQSSSQRRTSA